MMVVVMMVVVMVDAVGETVVKRLWFRSTSDTFLEDIDTIDRMIADGESQYDKWRHHDPYIVPWAPGGSKFTRNPTPPAGIEIVYDYGREDH
ncbi:putative NADH dehydrogenase [ubiquinone] 1 beta subcomplex subunit 9 [Helianthus annuus]|nr:putative NADH dehydrogenase [ubiquinone] 1 beta subcomplex subunit 9 [Helianthus annuus]